MPDLSIYNLRGIDAYVQNFSTYAEYFENPLLPEELVTFNCCLSYFDSYDLSNLSVSYDPGLPRNERALELPGNADFISCAGENPQYQVNGCAGAKYYGNNYYGPPYENVFSQPPAASILVYPNCSVTLTVQGRAYFNITIGLLSNIPSIAYYGDIQVRASAYEYPQGYAEDRYACSYEGETCFTPCCPMGSPEDPESDFSWVTADGLNWNNMPDILYRENSNEYPLPSSTALDFACCQANWASAGLPGSWSISPIYPSCINYIPDNTPVIDYPGGGISQRLTYNLIHRFSINKSYYCCAGDVVISNGFGSCTGPSGSTVSPVSEYTPDYYKDIDLIFFYTNNRRCVTRLDLALNIGDYCLGSNLTVSAEVIQSPAC